jgi:hypothetical protein
MTRICAWCGRQLGDGEPCLEREVTHGLCEQCRQKYFASANANEKPTVLATSQPVKDNDHPPGANAPE